MRWTFSVKSSESVRVGRVLVGEDEVEGRCADEGIAMALKM